MKEINFDQDLYIVNAHTLRGRFIDYFSILEKTIEEFISEYFTNDYNRGIELSDIILDRLTFDAKRASMRSIVRVMMNEGKFQKLKGKPIPNDEYFSELKALSDHRNKFAHYPLAFPFKQGEFGNVIGLDEFRDYIKTEWYNQQRYDSIISKIGKYIKYTKSFKTEIAP